MIIMMMIIIIIGILIIIIITIVRITSISCSSTPLEKRAINELSQEKRRGLWNAKLSYCVHKIPPLTNSDPV
jgi:hypothetical protein